MKVAFVLGTSTGGIARHVQMLAAGCAARGVAAEVFGPAQTGREFGFSDGDPEDQGQIRFTPVEIADRPRVHGDLRTIARLRRLLAAWRPDVVHAHGLRAGALAAIAIAFIRPTAYDKKPALVVTVHNAPPAGGTTGAVYRVLELIVARNADSALCVSADLEHRMRAAGAHRVARALVPAPAGQPADVSAETRAAIRAEFGASPDQALVLAVGRLAPQKGFTFLLDGAARWADIHPRPLLVIAGEGPLAASLRSRASSAGLPVRFAGHRHDVPALLAAADIFVLSSIWEGQSLILQEALRAAVPIVATRVGGTPDLTGEDAAILIPPADPESVAETVRMVLADPALSARLRQGAEARARTLPTEDQAVAAALAEYRHLTR